MTGMMAHRIRRVREIMNEVRFARQRVTRGWDDRALWSLDYHLARSLGHQLLGMADSAHTYPSGDEWSFERWTSELRRHGEALVAYSKDDTLNHAKGYEGARSALVWVAIHLRDLWD